MTTAKANDETVRAPREIVIERVFDAPRALVFEHWIDPENVRTWFAPRGFDVTACELDARAGGRWRVEYRSSTTGEGHIESGELLEVSFPEKLVLTLTQEDSSGHSGPRTTVSVTFVEQGSRTKMVFRQTGFTSPTHRDANAEGWEECFGKLERNLTRRA